MGIEGPTNTSEYEEEKIPTSEEVRRVFEQLAEGRELKDVRIREDENGFYLWEVAVTLEDGIKIEYSYMRQGEYLEGSPKKTAIHMTEFDKDGNPVYGTTVALFENGAWNLIH